MKQNFWRRLLTRKWIVPVAALVLTLSIGSVAFAMNDASSGQCSTATTAAATAGTTATTVAKSSTSSTSDTSSAAVLVVRADASETTSTTVAATGDDSLALDQAKENAILDLIRQKMTPTDQTTLDKLRAAAATEQTDVQQAQAALANTTAQITALVNKYLGISTTTSTTGS